MDQLSDFITAIQTDLSVDSNSSLYSPTVITLAINRSYRKCAGLYLWPGTEDSQTTSSKNGVENYDYPDNWRPFSAWKLTVGGTPFGDPLQFKDYQNEKENITPSGSLPSGETNMWTNYGNQYFFYPIPTADGNNDITIWGQKAVSKLVNSTDTTIFSSTMPEGNEAVLLEAVAILKNKGDLIQPVQRSFVGGTFLLSIEAQNILRNAWSKIAEAKAKSQKTVPMFSVPDFFGRKVTNRDIIGDFEV